MSTPLLVAPLKVPTTLPAVGHAHSTRSSALSGSGFGAGDGSTFATGGVSGFAGAAGTGSDFGATASRGASPRCNSARFSSEYGSRTPFGSVLTPADCAGGAGVETDGAGGVGVETDGAGGVGVETDGAGGVGAVTGGPAAAPGGRSASSGRVTIGCVAPIGLTTTLSVGAGPADGGGRTRRIWPTCSLVGSASWFQLASSRQSTP